MPRLIAFLHRLEEGTLAFLLAAMTLVTFGQVMARYLFNTGAIWALELTSFLFAWLVILGMAYGVRIHSHIGVDAFIKLFDKPKQRILGVIAILAGLSYAVLLLYGSWEQTFGIIYEYEIEAEDLKIPLWIPLSVLIIGFSTMIVRLLLITWRVIMLGESPELIADESREAVDQFAELEEESERQEPKA